MLAVPEDGRAVAAIVKLIGRDIPMVVVPGIAEAELEMGERRRRGSRGAARSEHRPRAGNGDGRARVAAEHRPHAGDGGARVKAEHRPHASNGDAGARVAAEHRTPRRDRRPAERQAPLASGNGSNVTPFPRAAEVGKTRPHERQGEEKRVVGFGDHLPAFLARPSRIVAGP